jgi:hypothetical protein
LTYLISEEMKSAFQYKFERYQLLKEKNDKLLKIDAQEDSLKSYTNHEIKVSNARIHYAATKMNALVRGYLDRIICRRLRLRARAIRLIQKVMKGKLGRIRWRKEYWRALSIVKSENALKELIQRSTMIREKIIRLKRQKDHWKEMYDPLSDSFWYLNEITRQNTWQIPVCFQKNLICHWTGYNEAGGLSSAISIDTKSFIEHLQETNYTSLPHVPCRCVFSTVHEYHSHLRTMHAWYCVACYQRNPGLTFPKCSLCGNKVTDDGENTEKILRDNVNKVQDQLVEFIEKDMKQSINQYQSIPYHVKDRLIEIAMERKDTLEKLNEARRETKKARRKQTEEKKLQNQNKILSLVPGDDDNSSVGSSSTINDKAEKIKENYKRRMSVTFSAKQERLNLVANKLSAGVFAGKTDEVNDQTSLKLPPIPGAASQDLKEKNPPDSRSVGGGSVRSSSSKGSKGREKKSLTRTGTVSNLSRMATPGFATARTSSTDSLDDYSTTTGKNNNSNTDQEIDYYSTVAPEFPAEIINTSVVRKAKIHQFVLDGGEKGELERYADPLTKGFFTEQDFNVLTSIHEEKFGDWEMELLSSDDEDEENSNMDSFMGKNTPAKQSSNASAVSNQSSITNKDELARLLVCTDYLKGKCTSTTCPLAHPGIRDHAKMSQKSFRNPDGKGFTRVPYVFICPNIQTSLTDCANGMNCKCYHAYIRPTTSDIILALYPINTGHKIKYFPSGAKYMGNVKNGEFHGYGVMYWPDGSIYMGEWAKNEKNGFGTYHSPNRTIEYIGQFLNGKRHGWGILKNQLGDEYVGKKFSVYRILTF